jgi:hypothetical protein
MQNRAFRPLARFPLALGTITKILFGKIWKQKNPQGAGQKGISLTMLGQGFPCPPDQSSIMFKSTPISIKALEI